VWRAFYYETGGVLSLLPVMRESISNASGSERVFIDDLLMETHSLPLAVLSF
jgi:hypothetical protein